MIKGNEALYSELNKSLDSIKNKIKSENLKIYPDDFNELSRIIEDSLKNPYQNTTFFNSKNGIVKCIMKIINKIDKAIQGLEVEMHGVSNYSDYELKKIKKIESKQEIKNVLNKMLQMIVTARPEMQDAELSIMIRRLK